MVHLLGKVWHITYQYEAHELLCLKVRRAFRLLRICAQDTQMSRKGWVSAEMRWVQDSKKYGSFLEIVCSLFTMLILVEWYGLW